MKYAMKQNGDSKENREEAKRVAFRDMRQYYGEDTPLIVVSVRRLNEYFRNMECSQRIIQYFCKINPSHLPGLEFGGGRPLRDFKTLTLDAKEWLRSYGLRKC